jgi:hypothetical protein
MSNQTCRSSAQKMAFAGDRIRRPAAKIPKYGQLYLLA